MTSSHFTNGGDYYKILGINKQTPQDKIRDAYLEVMCDTLACEINYQFPLEKAEFKKKLEEIREAYEVLSDPAKRHIYDRFGKDGLLLDEQPTPGQTLHSFTFLNLPNELYNFFNMPPPRGCDVTYNVVLTLNELYLGKTLEIALNRVVVCPKCGGKGFTEVSLQFSATEISLDNNVFQFQQVRVSSSNIQNGKSQCATCRGKKVIQERKTFEVQVKRGMRNGQKIVFKGEANQLPGIIPGDVILVVAQQEHPIFSRAGDDLQISKKLTLLEALFGFRCIIEHLDNRKLLISDSYIRPGSVKYLENEGMPKLGTALKGVLFIVFMVEFPKAGTLRDNDIQTLQEVLTTPPPIVHNNQHKGYTSKISSSHYGDKLCAKEVTLSRPPVHNKSNYDTTGRPYKRVRT